VTGLLENRRQGFDDSSSVYDLARLIFEDARKWLSKRTQICPCTTTIPSDNASGNTDLPRARASGMPASGGCGATSESVLVRRPLPSRLRDVACHCSLIVIRYGFE
jgi:hypothetical protein